MNDMIRKWRLVSHSSITINGNLRLDTSLFTDDQIIVADSEDEQQHSLYNLTENS